MIVLKADAMLKAVFQKTIRVMGTNVEWNDIFIIHNNSIILQGKLKSLVFNFDKRKVFGTVVDIPVKEEARLMLNNQMLENALNMNLYIFGKWGQIKGLTVEKNYAQLQKMINNVLEDIFVTAEFTKDRCRFYQDDKRITFEEVIEEFLKLMKPDFLQEEENDEVTAERENAGPAGKEKKGTKKRLEKCQEQRMSQKKMTTRKRMNTNNSIQGVANTIWDCGTIWSGSLRTRCLKKRNFPNWIV